MQHEIICPNCKKVFTIDKASYAEIVQQVRNDEFEQELESRLHTLSLANEKAIENTRLETRSEYEKKLSLKEQTVAELNLKLESAKTKQELAIAEATADLKAERDRLKNELDNAAALSSSREMMLRQNYEQQIQDREDTIERLKELRSKLSTKRIGENLEQHCQNEFNSIRATAYPRAKFGKDNVISGSGSKGDFIFRDFDESGVEYVSIMFEMKDEMDTTATKHKNEHFFKELDKDRREKGCEYAVLVTRLEEGNEFYDRGIVDVSYEYPKMFVIRPQFFLTLIGILTNAARSSLEYKAELLRVQNQNIDVTNFETKLNDFKEKFSRNAELATKNFNKAIEEIDKSITELEKTKEFLRLTAKNFAAADKKLDDLTIKRLTRNNPTMTAKFAELSD